MCHISKTKKLWFPSYLQEVGKFNLQINVIQNRLEKCISFTFNNKLIFIGSFRFLSSSLDSLVKSLSKNDFKYLIQDFDNNVLDLIKQKWLYPNEYMRDFKKFKEEFPSKQKFYSFLTGEKITDKEYEHVFNVWNKFEIKMMKDYHN